MNFVRRAIRSLLRETKIKEAINKEALGKEALGKEAMGKEAVGKETVAKETVGNEAISKETVRKETVPKETVPKETVPKETVPKERAAKETVDQFFALLASAKLQRVGEGDLTKKPWCAVCYIESKFPGDVTVNGTGFLVGAKTVITAAHNLSKLDKHGKRVGVSEVFVSLGSTPGNKSKTATATRFVYDKRYADNLEQRWNSELQKTDSSERRMKAVEFEDPSYYDYGAVLLDEELVPKSAFVFKVRGTESEDPYWDRRLTCAGYPGAAELELCYTEGAAFPDDKGRFKGGKSNLVVHRAIVKRGQSGGPLYLQNDDGEYVVVGINVRTNDGEKNTSGAVRITKDMQTVFAFWTEENEKIKSQFGRQKHDVDVDAQSFTV